MKKLIIISVLFSCSVAMAAEPKSLRERIFGPREAAAPATPGAPAEQKTGFFSRFRSSTPSAPPMPGASAEQKPGFFDRFRKKPSAAEGQQQAQQRAQYEAFKQKQAVSEQAQRAKEEKKLAAERERKAMLEKVEAEKARQRKQREAKEKEVEGLRKQITKKQFELRKITEQIKSIDSRFTDAFLERGVTLQERIERERAMKAALKHGDEKRSLQQIKDKIEKELRKLENKKIEIELR